MKYRNLIDTLDKFEIAIQRTEPLYFNAIEKFNELRDDLTQLDANEHLLEIVKPYLSKWGDMARVVERDDLDWEEYASLIRSLAKLPFVKG